jgi:acylphosphatase
MGRVQGVYFRASTREMAKRLDVKGWVKNTRDGAVELEAQGPRKKVQGLIDYVRVGPDGARVENVDVTEVEPRGSESDFVIVGSG